MSEQGKSRCPGCEPTAPNHVHPGRYPDHCSVCHQEAAQCDCKLSGYSVQKLGKEIQVDGFKDEHIHLALGRKEAQRVLSTLPARSPDRRVLVVLRGLPGSGKSTVAQAIVDSDPARWARVSKDDLRQMMVGPNGDLFRFVEDRAREVVVAKTTEEMTMSALRLGLDVVVDATNLTNRALNSWRMAAMVVNRDGHGPVLVCERAVPTPVEECVARDKLRGTVSLRLALTEGSDTTYALVQAGLLVRGKGG